MYIFCLLFYFAVFNWYVQLIYFLYKTDDQIVHSVFVFTNMENLLRFFLCGKLISCVEKNSSRKANFDAKKCWLLLCAIITKLRFVSLETEIFFWKCALFCIFFAERNQMSKKKKIGRILIDKQYSESLNIWMSFNHNPSWMVIGNFYYSVSGLIRFFHLLLTPRDNIPRVY